MHRQDACATEELLSNRGALEVALVFGESEPRFGEVADALQFFLHIGMLGFEECGVGVGRDFDRRSEDHHGF